MRRMGFRGRPRILSRNACAIHAAVLALLLAACSGGGDATDPTDPGTDPGTTPTGPVTVSVTADNARAGRGIVTSEEGGVVTATGADGTVYSLSVPAGAVFEDSLEITVTPIASVSGMRPGTSSQAGAVFGPDGFEFHQAATLIITRPAPFASTGSAAYGFDGTGSEFHLRPGQVAGNVASIPVLHFSGGGVGSFTPPALQAQYSSTPSSWQNQAAQASAQLTACQATGCSQQQQLQNQVNALFTQAYTTTIRPALAAVNSCASMNSALVQYNNWWMAAQVMVPGGPPAALDADARVLVDAAMRACIKESDDNCRVSHTVAASFRQLIKIAFLADIGFGKDGPAVKREAEAAIARCFTFELELDASVTISEAGVTQKATGRGKIELRFEIDPVNSRHGLFAKWTEGQIAWSGVTVTHPTCTVKLTPAPGSTWEAAGDMNLRLVTDPRVEVQFGAAGSENHVREVICNGVSDGEQPIDIFWQGWLAVNHDMVSNQITKVAFDRSEIQGGALYARRTISRTVPNAGGATVSEQATINFWHRGR